MNRMATRLIPGIPALRTKIAEQYPHLNLAMTDVVVTCGSQEAMTAAVMSLVDRGDDVLLPNPSFPAYDACVRIAEGNPVYYRLPADKDFAFDIDEFRTGLTPEYKGGGRHQPFEPDRKDLDCRRSAADRRCS